MKIPRKMRAVVLTGHGGPDKLEIRNDWPVPEPGPRDVLIRVSACGMNNTDVNTRSGWYAKQVTTATTGEAAEGTDLENPTWGGGSIAFPRIQGADVVGEVVACGAEADQGLLGKRVMTDNWLRDWDDPTRLDGVGYFGSEQDGGFAEFTMIDHRNVGTVQTGLSDAELATFSCSYTTAEGMLENAGVGSRDLVLVTGASGGVGSALVQLAKRRRAMVIALASEAKHVLVAELGADIVLPRSPENLSEAIWESAGTRRVTVVADVVGGPAWPGLIEQLCRGGRYVCSGAIAGPMVSFDLRTLYLNDLTLFGSTIVPPHIFRNLVRYIENGEVRPLLAATYPLEDFHAAQAAFVSKKHFGNVVMTLPDR